MSKFSRKKNSSWKRKLLHAAVVFSLIMVLFFQVITLVAIHPQSIVNTPQAILDATWLFPTLLITVILAYATVFLYKVWKKAELRLLIPAVMGIVAAVMATVVALTIRAAYTDVVGVDGAIALTDWEWFWQQCTLILVPLVTAVISIIRYKKARDNRLSRKESTYEEQFASEESTLFGDNVSTGDKKLSKKQRKALKENSGN